MGLDIRGSVTNKHWHSSYSGLHLVRKLALVALGFPSRLDGIFPTCYVIPEMTSKELNDALQAIQLAAHHFPNLMLHSDCEGKYTKDGKVNPDEDWEQGNSIGLLDELEKLKNSIEDNFRNGWGWDLLIQLHELVEDEVKNGKGEVLFS